MFKFKSNKNKELVARARAVRNTPFLLTLDDFRESNGIMALYNHSLGLPVDLQACYWMDDELAEPDYEVSGNGTAIIRFNGIVRAESRWYSSVAGLYQLTDLNYRLADDGRVKRTVYHMTTPGGSDNRLDDFCQSVIYHKEKKPIFCYGHDIVASAGGWMFADMSGIYCDRLCQVGGFGVYAVLRDITRFLEEQLGYKYVLVSSGGVKGLGADGKVTAELEDDVKRLIMDDAELFKEALGRRAALSGKVDELFDGRVHIGAKAQELGLVDGVMPYKEFLEMVDSGLMPEEIEGYGMDGGRIGDHESKSSGSETESESESEVEEMAGETKIGSGGNVTVSEGFFEKLLAIFGGKEEEKPIVGLLKSEPPLQSGDVDGKAKQMMLNFAKKSIKLEIEKYVDLILASKSVTPAQAKTEGLRDSLCWIATQSFLAKLNGNDAAQFNVAKATVPSLCEYIQISGESAVSPNDFFAVSDPFGPIVAAFGVVPQAIKVLGGFSLGEEGKDEIPKGGGKSAMNSDTVFGEDGLPLEWSALSEKVRQMYVANMGRTKEGLKEEVAKANYDAWRAARMAAN